MVEGEGRMAEEPRREKDREREVVLRFRMPRLTLIPDEARGHLRAAQKEMLLAVRSMVDACIESIDERDRDKGTRTTRIEVQ